MNVFASACQTHTHMYVITKIMWEITQTLCVCVCVNATLTFCCCFYISSIESPTRAAATTMTNTVQIRRKTLCLIFVSFHLLLLLLTHITLAFYLLYMSTDFISRWICIITYINSLSYHLCAALLLLLFWLLLFACFRCCTELFFWTRGRRMRRDFLYYQVCLLLSAIGIFFILFKRRFLYDELLRDARPTCSQSKNSAPTDSHIALSLSPP